jgi:hypothetical protein
MSDKPDDLSPVYYRVSPAFWMNRAWTDEMRLLGVYLLTSPHRSLEGLFWLPKPYILGDLRWDAERLAEPFAKLLADGFIDYEETVEVLLMPKALKYQAPSNPNMVTAALKRIQIVPACRLDEDFQAAASRYCERLAKRLHELLPERFGKPQLYSTQLSSTHAREDGPVDNSTIRPASRVPEDPAPERLDWKAAADAIRTHPREKVAT